MQLYCICYWLLESKCSLRLTTKSTLPFSVLFVHDQAAFDNHHHSAVGLDQFICINFNSNILNVPFQFFNCKVHVCHKFLLSPLLHMWQYSRGSKASTPCLQIFPLSLSCCKTGHLISTWGQMETLRFIISLLLFTLSIYWSIKLWTGSTTGVAAASLLQVFETWTPSWYSLMIPSQMLLKFTKIANRNYYASNLLIMCNFLKEIYACISVMLCMNVCR